MMYNSLADLKTKKATTVIIQTIAMELACSSLRICVKTTCSLSPLTGRMMFTARKAHRMRLTTVTNRTWSVASEYQWAAADNVDVVAGISYDWRDSLEGMKHEKMVASPTMMTTISRPSTGR